MDLNRNNGGVLLDNLRQETNYRVLQFFKDLNRSYDPEYLEKKFYRDAAENVWIALWYREWIGGFKDYLLAHQLDYESEFYRRDFELWDSMGGMSYHENLDYKYWLSDLEKRKEYYFGEKSRLLSSGSSVEQNEQINVIDGVLSCIENDIAYARHVLELEKERDYLKEAKRLFKEILQNVCRLYTTVDSFLNEGKHSSLNQLVDDEMLFTVAIGKIMRIVNKASIFENPLTPDDLLQVLNVNPRYSGIKIVENKKSWVISFIYLLANFYKEFEDQDSDLWAKRIVPFLGIDYSKEYQKRKNQKEKSVSAEYKDFMVQLEDCLDRYNLLLKFGRDNNSRDSFMKRFQQ